MNEQVEAFYEIAASAYEANNAKEAEVYCNKIIEIDPTYLKAWALKGLTIGRQSTIYENRLSEAVVYLSRAINNQTDMEIKSKVINLARYEITQVAFILIEEYLYLFENLTSTVESVEMNNHLMIVFQALDELRDKAGISVIKEVSEISYKITDDIVKLWTEKIIMEYKQNHLYEKYKLKISACDDVLKKIMNCYEKAWQGNKSHEYYDFMMNQYNNLIEINRTLVHEIEMHENTKTYTKLQNEMKLEMEEFKKEQKRQYWEKNSEEKVEIQVQLTKIEVEVMQLQADNDDILNQEKIKQKQIDNLKKGKALSAIFNKSKHQQKTTEIEQLASEMKKLFKKTEEITNSINSLIEQKDILEYELSRER